MRNDRLRHLEMAPPSPDATQRAVEKIGRFDNLEIAGAPTAPAPPTSPRLATCHHCGQLNREDTQACWACHRWVRGKAEDVARFQDPFTFLLNGKAVRSDDPSLPAPVRQRLEEIRRGGANATHNILDELPRLPAAAGTVVAVKIDGKLYRSDDESTPEDLKPLFAHIAAHGLTPALMEDLRRQGHKVKYRPASSLAPTDGDELFWQDRRLQDIAEPPVDPDRRAPLWVIGVFILLALFLARIAGTLVSQWIRTL